MNDTGSPFDDIRRLLAELPGPEAVGGLHGAPPQGLGRLDELAEWLAVWQGRAVPSVQRPRMVIFASSHGLIARWTDDGPRFASDAMAAFAAGGTAVNRICATFDIGLKVFDLAVDVPTGDITAGPAMDERMCAATMAFGMEATEGDVDLLCLGEAGLGSETIAAAIFHALWGGRPEDWISASSDADRATWAANAAAISSALAYHRHGLTDPLEILRRLGGRDVAAMAGAIAAARIQRIPVLLDGVVAAAAAAILHAADPGNIDHCRAAHCSGERAHREALGHLGLAPLLDLGIKHGAGAGAALAVALAKSAVACHQAVTEQAE